MTEMTASHSAFPLVIVLISGVCFTSLINNQGRCYLVDAFVFVSFLANWASSQHPAVCLRSHRQTFPICGDCAGTSTRISLGNLCSGKSKPIKVKESGSLSSPCLFHMKLEALWRVLLFGRVLSGRPDQSPAPYTAHPQAIDRGPSPYQV